MPLVHHSNSKMATLLAARKYPRPISVYQLDFLTPGGEGEGSDSGGRWSREGSQSWAVEGREPRTGSGESLGIFSFSPLIIFFIIFGPSGHGSCVDWLATRPSSLTSVLFLFLSGSLLQGFELWSGVCPPTIRSFFFSFRLTVFWCEGASDQQIGPVGKGGQLVRGTFFQRPPPSPETLRCCDCSLVHDAASFHCEGLRRRSIIVGDWTSWNRPGEATPVRNSKC